MFVVLGKLDFMSSSNLFKFCFFNAMSKTFHFFFLPPKRKILVLSELNMKCIINFLSRMFASIHFAVIGFYCCFGFLTMIEQKYNFAFETPICLFSSRLPRKRPFIRKLGVFQKMLIC